MHSKKLSVLGFLTDRFDHSGVMGREIISDNELNKLSCLIEDQINISIDFQDSPSVEFWTCRRESVKRLIEARHS